MTDFTASSYDLARVTKTPVILVVDAAGQSHSVVALIKGFLEYGEERLIQGIILNRISPMLFPAMKECIEKELPVKVLGFLPKCPQCVWQSRHLGLLLPGEVADLQHQIGELSAKLKESLDLETLLALAEQAPDLECEREMREETAPDSKVRIGVAQDEAFCFYYEDNLRLLEKMGARLVPFSPLHDRELPAVDGLLLGGGYPELHCGELSANHGMLGDICKAAGRKMPMLAECGGFLYLQKSMTDMSGNTWKMADVLHGTVQPTGKLVRFGYLELTGHRIRGHEFHYFDCSENGSADRAVKPGSGRSWDCMVEENGIIAGFPHLYYYSNPEFVRQFLQHCAAYRDAQERIGS
jgi:cobyrinic acid a,c-diamide synthase